ncbi:hmg box-containing protein [Ophiostoma piceae UAMH 11346]|uniref:Hmg box-containing protein n=1 Tax=Ophiostoma piceae (strain UAMH 11346) TaxID=1262450 RepID=S3BQU1_OPHP1|nr:hmg box-containing protein [Ophiostoma piceae UAMH 11346]
MARARRRIIVDSDDEIDDIGFLQLSPPSSIPSKTSGAPQARLVARTPRAPRLQQTDESSTPAPKTATRRRKLGNLGNDAFLLRPWSGNALRTPTGQAEPMAPATEIDLPFDASPEPRRQKQTRPRVELRTRRSRRVSDIPADESVELSTEEVSVLENVTLGEDGIDGDEADAVSTRRKPGSRRKINKTATPSHSDGEDTENHTSNIPGTNDTNDTNSVRVDNEAEGEMSTSSESGTDSETETGNESEASEFQDASMSDGEFSDGSLDDFFTKSPPKHTAQVNTLARGKATAPTQSQSTPSMYTDEGSSVFFSAEESFHGQTSKSKTKETKCGGRSKSPPEETSKPTTTKSSGLLSPTKKLPRIPQTPHRSNTDAFWDQMIVDDWNTEHSPRKLLFEHDASKNIKKRTTKSSTVAGNGTAAASDASSLTASPLKRSATTAAREKEAKKLFQKAKHDMAKKFLIELDTTITKGELGRLAAATGGVRIDWTNKLNTTAGRANWRRETLRPKASSTVVIADDDDSTASAANKASTAPATRVLHHASIELAEKVIDDEHRLLNVIAHEFCHLANFMVSGITGNPHGKEFKAWAAQCSLHFGDRGIQVTTKHAYEIDFKYVWTCEACTTEFKRHSKSIDPSRHRCGACKGTLKQTKPTPRGSGARVAGAKGAGAAAGPAATPGPSEYQKFMKEHMAAVRRDNPQSPQKDIMRLVADKWSKAKERKLAGLRSEIKADKSEAGVEMEGKGLGMDQLDKAFVDLTLG